MTVVSRNLFRSTEVLSLNWLEILKVFSPLSDNADTCKADKIMPVLDKIRSASLYLPLEENLSCLEQIIQFIGRINVKSYTPKNRVSGDKKCGYSQLCLGCHNFELHAGQDGCVLQNGEPELGAESNVKLCRHIPLAVIDKMFYVNFLSSIP
jgi:hypothetical protein